MPDMQVQYVLYAAFMCIIYEIETTSRSYSACFTPINTLSPRALFSDSPKLAGGLSQVSDKLLKWITAFGPLECWYSWNKFHLH